MRNSLLKSLIAAATLVGALNGAVRADVLLDNTNLIASPTAAAPSMYSFTASTAQALTLTLTDFQAPAAFSSLQVAVTLGDTLIGMVAADSTTHVATLAIPAATGTYTVYVIGTPTVAAGSTTSAGAFGVCVAPTTAATNCIAADSFSGDIQTPAMASTTPSSSLDTEFVSTVAGVYTVTITDDAFPVALQSVTGGMTNGSTPVNPTGFTLGANQITLAAGTTYTLILGALADATVQAGLYSVHIADPAGAAVFDRTLPVGTLPASTVVNNPSAQALNLTLNDLMYPAPLTSVGVAVTSGSTSLATLTASGSVPNFMAPAGSIEIWQYAVEGAQPGVYSLNLSNLANTSSLFTTTKVVNPSAASGQSFAFVGTLSTAGTYTLTATDFQFPSALQSISATVAQNGAVLTQSSTGAFAAAAGNIVVLVNAAAATGGSGIFDVSVTSTASAAQSVLDQTQSVGGVFTTQSIVLTTSGSYDVTLTDLGFPANFSDLAVVVSQGSDVLGKAFGGGTFTFSGTPGTYVVTIVDTPSATANYGLYSIHVASSAPTVTLTASATSVTAGSNVTLNWSTQSATACTASGATGWTGSQMTSGTLALAVSATETLTLNCTGPGGAASQSVSVTTTAAPPAKNGGGGGLDLGTLGALVALVVIGRHRLSRVCKTY
jgi:hypothetical protein